MSLSVHIKPNNLVRQEATESQKDYAKNIIPYGVDDNFPLRLARLVQKSVTASSCIETKSEFIEGAGFSNETLADKIVNGLGERFGDIHSRTSNSLALNEGFAWNVKYNMKGLITEIYTIPFEYCRFGIPDSKGVIAKIMVNPQFGNLTEYKTNDTKEYDVYNPDPKAVLAQMEKEGKKYKGQILYFGTTGPLNRFYPNPAYYSCSNWMSIEDSVGLFHRKNIDNGFFTTTLFKMIGDENQPSTHPDDVKWNDDRTEYVTDPSKTFGMRFNIEMQKFLGAENANTILTQWAATKEAMPEIQAFPTNTNSELFKFVSDSATENISRATKVPSVLSNIASGASLGGDGNLIRASVKLMQQRVVKPQAMLERVYKDVLTKMEAAYTEEVKILNYNPFPEMEKIDPLIWAALPIESQRAWIKKNTSFEIIETATPQPAAPVNKFSNMSYSHYPEGAKKVAAKVVAFRNQSGSKCGGKAGWSITDDIINGKPLSFKIIKRIHNFLEKNKGFKNNPYSESCESVLYSGWGGDEMLNWTKQIIQSINE